MHRLGVGAVEPARSDLSRDRLAHHDAVDRRMLDAAHLLRDMAVPFHAHGSVDLPALLDDAGKHRKLFEWAVRDSSVHAVGGRAGAWVPESCTGHPARCRRPDTCLS